MSATIHIVDASHAKRSLDQVTPSDRFIVFKARTETWIGLSGIHEQAQDAISAREPPETTDPPSQPSTARRGAGGEAMRKLAQASISAGAGSTRSVSIAVADRCAFASAASAVSAQVTRRLPSVSYRYQRRSVLPLCVVVACIP